MHHFPTHVTLSAQVITDDGRSAVSADPEGLRFPWKLSSLEPLDDLSVSHGCDHTLSFPVLGGRG